MRRTRTVVSLFVLLAGSAAFAQGRQDWGAEALDRGARQFARHEYAAALESFRAAQALSPNVAVVFDVAVCLDRLDRHAEAMTEYRRYARLRGQEIEPARRAAIEEATGRLRREVAVLRLPEVPAEISVRLDEQPVDPADGEIVVSAGQHVLTTERNGLSVAQVLDLQPGEERDVRLRVPAAQRRPELDLDVPAPATAPVDPLDDRFPRRRLSPTWRWVGVGASTLLAAGLVYTALRATSLSAEYQAAPTRELFDEGVTTRDLAQYFFFPATIASVGLTVVAFVLSSPEPTSELTARVAAQ